MGKGSIGNITSAAVVAASSFDMEITDPRAFLEKVVYFTLFSNFVLNDFSLPLFVIEFCMVLGAFVFLGKKNIFQ